MCMWTYNVRHEERTTGRTWEWSSGKWHVCNALHSLHIAHDATKVIDGSLRFFHYIGVYVRGRPTLNQITLNWIHLTLFHLICCLACPFSSCHCVCITHFVIAVLYLFPFLSSALLVSIITARRTSSKWINATEENACSLYQQKVVLFMSALLLLHLTGGQFVSIHLVGTFGIMRI